MNTINKQPANDRLRDLFREIPLESPSEDFTKKLISRIEKEAAREKKQKEWLSMAWIFSGVIGILGIPATIFYFMGFNVTSEISQGFPKFLLPLFSAFKGLRIDSSVVMLGGTILALLILDTLLRKMINKRKEKPVEHV